MIDEATLQRIEEESRSGLTSAQILELFAAHGVFLSEATLRKYVQLGLVPRSVRVGQKGKHRGSRGLYPARVVRRIVLIKNMMARSYTIAEIQKEILFLSSDIEQVEASLAEVFKKIGQRLQGTDGPMEPIADVAKKEVALADRLGQELVDKLRGIEGRLKGRHPQEA